MMSHMIVDLVFKVKHGSWRRMERWEGLSMAVVQVAMWTRLSSLPGSLAITSTPHRAAQAHRHSLTPAPRHGPSQVESLQSPPTNNQQSQVANN